MALKSVLGVTLVFGGASGFYMNFPEPSDGKSMYEWLETSVFPIVLLSSPKRESYTLERGDVHLTASLESKKYIYHKQDFPAGSRSVNVLLPVKPAFKKPFTLAFTAAVRNKGSQVTVKLNSVIWKSILTDVLSLASYSAFGDSESDREYELHYPNRTLVQGARNSLLPFSNLVYDYWNELQTHGPRTRKFETTLYLSPVVNESSIPKAPGNSDPSSLLPESDDIIDERDSGDYADDEHTPKVRQGGIESRGIAHTQRPKYDAWYKQTMVLSTFMTRRQFLGYLLDHPWQ
jgi:hypothetical protein